MSSYKTSFLILFTLLSSLYQDSLLEMTDDTLILETVKLPENQETLRFSWNNTVAAKTSFQSFSLLQVTDGVNFYRFLSLNGDLIDCGFESEPGAIKDFVDNFKSQACVKDYDPLIYSCERQRNVLTKDRLPNDLSWILETDLEKKCRSFHEGSESGKNIRVRRKRDILFPGTNWCGSGFSSNSFKELGVNAAADRCCRDHDHCKHYILPFSWKYHLFNYRFHTVSHCRCDERFRACLKAAKTSVSDMIGKLFFNIAKTKCFSFKREKTCKKRSWWGKCLKTKRSKKAFFKGGLFY